MSKGPFLLVVIWPNGKRQALSFHRTAARAREAARYEKAGATVRLHEQLRIEEAR